MRKTTFLLVMLIYCLLSANHVNADDNKITAVAATVAFNPTNSNATADGSASANAIDGDENTYWESTVTSSQFFFCVDLGKEYDISKIVLKWKDQYYPTSITLRYSTAAVINSASTDNDGYPGTSLKSVSTYNATGMGPVTDIFSADAEAENFKINVVTARYVAFQTRGRNNGDGIGGDHYELKEFEIYGSEVIPVTVTAANVTIISPALNEQNRFYIPTLTPSSVITFKLNDGSANPRVALNGSPYALGEPEDGVYSITLNDPAAQSPVAISATSGFYKIPAISATSTRGDDAATSSGFIQANAIDGDESTYWKSTAVSSNIYFCVDLGKAYDISKIILKWKDQYYTRSITLRYSTTDIITNTVLGTELIKPSTYNDEGMGPVTDIFSTDAEGNFQINAFTARYVAFQTRGRNNGTGIGGDHYELKEFEVYGKAVQVTVNATNVTLISPVLDDQNQYSSASSSVITFRLNEGYENPAVTFNGVDYTLEEPTDGVYSITLDNPAEQTPVCIGAFPPAILPGATVDVAVYTGYEGDIVFHSDDTGTGQLTGATTFTPAGKVKLVKTFKTGQWYPIGFPFAVDNENIAIKYGTESKEGVIYNGDKGKHNFSDNGTKGNFFVREYNAENNYFVFDDAIAAGTGYIVEFPKAEFDNAEEVEVTFVSTSSPELTIGATGGNIPSDNANLSLIVNPNVSNITGIENAMDYYQYNYSPSDPRFSRIGGQGGTGDITLSTPLKPFEAIVAVKTGTDESGFRSSIGDGSGGVTTLEPLPGVDAPQEVRYYTVQGVRIDSPQANGVYIVKKIYASGKTGISKVIYRNKGI